MYNHIYEYEKLVKSNKQEFEMDTIFLLLDLTINDLEDTEAGLDKTDSISESILYLSKIFDFIIDNKVHLIEGEFIKELKLNSIAIRSAKFMYHKSFRLLYERFISLLDT